MPRPQVRKTPETKTEKTEDVKTVPVNLEALDKEAQIVITSLGVNMTSRVYGLIINNLRRVVEFFRVDLGEEPTLAKHERAPLDSRSPDMPPRIRLQEHCAVIGEEGGYASYGKIVSVIQHQKEIDINTPSGIRRVSTLAAKVIIGETVLPERLERVGQVEDITQDVSLGRTRELEIVAPFLVEEGEVIKGIDVVPAYTPELFYTGATDIPIVVSFETDRELYHFVVWISPDTKDLIITRESLKKGEVVELKLEQGERIKRAIMFPQKREERIDEEGVTRVKEGYSLIIETKGGWLHYVKAFEVIEERRLPGLTAKEGTEKETSISYLGELDLREDRMFSKDFGKEKKNKTEAGSTTRESLSEPFIAEIREEEGTVTIGVSLIRTEESSLVFPEILVVSPQTDEIRVEERVAINGDTVLLRSIIGDAISRKGKKPPVWRKPETVLGALVIGEKNGKDIELWTAVSCWDDTSHDPEGKPAIHLVKIEGELSTNAPNGAHIVARSAELVATIDAHKEWEAMKEHPSRIPPVKIEVTGHKKGVKSLKVVTPFQVTVIENI